MADPEKPKTLVESIRRFTDARISSILHSLIGLPSMLQPPSNCGDDGGEVSGRSQTTTTNKAPSTPPPPRGEEVGGGGNKRVVGDFCDVFGNPVLLRFEGDLVGECLKSLTLIPFPNIPEEVFLTRDKGMDSRLREVLGMVVEEGEARRMERLGSACALPKSATGTPSSSKIISCLASTHFFTGLDGATRTNYVFKPQFVDGSEESAAEEPTEHPHS